MSATTNTLPAVASAKLGVCALAVAAFGVAAIALGAFVLAGWASGTIEYARLYSGAHPMHPAAALGFAFCGLGLLGLATDRRGMTLAGGVGSVLIAAIGLAEFALGTDLPVAWLFAAMAGETPAREWSSHLSPYAATILGILGAVLLVERQMRGAPQVAAMVLVLPAIALIILASLVQMTFWSNADTLDSWSSIVDRAFATSIGVSLVASGLAICGLGRSRSLRGLLPHWSAWLAGAAVAGASILFWQTLQEREHLNEEHGLQMELGVVREAFIDRIVTRFAPLMRIKSRWERGLGLPADVWRGMTTETLNTDRGFLAIVYVDRDYGFSRIQERGDGIALSVLGNATAVAPLPDLERASKSRDVLLTKPVYVPGSEPVFFLLVPLYENDAFSGFLGGAFSHRSVFDGLIEKYEATGLAVALRHNRDEVLASHSWTPGGGYAEQTFPLMTQTFTVAARRVVAPAVTHFRSHDMILFAGLVLAMVLVISLDSAIRARRRFDESEAQFRDTFENAPVAMSWVDSEGRLVKTNRAYQELLGYSAEELSGVSIKDLIHPSEHNVRGGDLKSLLRGEAMRLEREVKCIRKDGYPLWANISSSVIKSADRPPLLLSHLQDITARKSAEEKLFQSQKMESLGNLAGGIAHDFNNMLLPIIALTEVSQGELPEDHPLQENLGCVLEAANQASHLVQQILTFSRQNESVVTQVDVAHCVAEAGRLLRNVLPSSIDVRAEISQDVGTVMGDRAQLISVVMNLGSNAKHAMKDKTGTLTIRLERIVADAGIAARLPVLMAGEAYARLDVADNGCGMDAETVKKIFDPFFTTKAVGEGTGLGLSMVHGIVEKMGGTIDVASEVDVGTTFSIYLPFHRHTEAEMEADSMAARKAA